MTMDEIYYLEQCKFKLISSEPINNSNFIKYQNLVRIYLEGQHLMQRIFKSHENYLLDRKKMEKILEIIEVDYQV